MEVYGMQSNRITNVDKPARDREAPYMAPMWNSDGKLLPFSTDDDAQRGTVYPAGPIPQYQNGRVIGVSGVVGNQFQLFTANDNNSNTFKNYALSGTLLVTPLSELFLSEYNTQQIQNQIRYRVFVASGGKYKIGPQDNTELEVIMRAMLLQYGKFLPDRLREQVIELNRLVVDFAWPRILTEIEQYIEYSKTLEYLPEVIPLPKNVSSKGTRTLSSVTTTF